MNIVMCYSSDLGGRRTGIADKFHSKATLFDDWRQILMSSMSLFTECTTRATAKPEVINLISEQRLQYTVYSNIRRNSTTAT